MNARHVEKGHICLDLLYMIVALNALKTAVKSKTCLETCICLFFYSFIFLQFVLFFIFAVHFFTECRIEYRLMSSRLEIIWSETGCSLAHHRG